MPSDQTIPFRLVKRRLLSACRKLVRQDSDLFKFDVNERTITQRISLYLAPKFPSHAVDCEYNRNLGDPKRLPIRVRQVASDDTNGVTVFPDIVVHKRGNHDLNLLVVEAKKNAVRNAVPVHDAQKLKAFTDQRGDFKYSWGAFLNFYKNGDLVEFEIRWFWNARERSESEMHDVMNLREIT